MNEIIDFFQYYFHCNSLIPSFLNFPFTQLFKPNSALQTIILILLADLEARRFDQTTIAPSSSGGGSADAEARRRAMIAAAEAREKKHKSQNKTIKHVTKSTLLKQQQQQQNIDHDQAPQTEASRRAAAAAKQGEADLAAELGYNPYEAIKKTAGQARSATTTTQHGAITAPGGSGSSTAASAAPIPAVASPSSPTTAASEQGETMIPDDPNFPIHEFEEALATVASASDKPAAKNGLKIAKKLITNATTKGQQANDEAAEKFRRVRLANPKIKAAIVDVPGNLSLMLSVGFELHPDDANPEESLLVFPPFCSGPTWLTRGLEAMDKVEQRFSV